MEGDLVIAATVAVLEDWYLAIENGTVQYRFPGGASSYSDEDIDRIIAAIDEEIDGEIERNKPHWSAKGIFRGSGFVRLASLQKRALVEDVARAVKAAREEMDKVAAAAEVA
jgi:hypothetical protein